MWSASLGQGSRGCRSCADTGSKPHQPGVTYLIVNVKLGAIKVGITGVDTDRLKTFRQLGWVVHIEKFKTGYEATSVEGAILNWWRIERALPPYLSPEDIPINGATETAELEMMPIYGAVERIGEAATRTRERPLSAA